MADNLHVISTEIESEEADGTGYSMRAENGKLIINGEVIFEDQAGEIEIVFADPNMANHLRDLAEKLDNPEIKKYRVGTCEKCSGIVDLHLIKLKKDQDPKEVKICRSCKLAMTKNEMFKL